MSGKRITGMWLLLAVLMVFPPIVVLLGPTAPLPIGFSAKAFHSLLSTQGIIGLGAAIATLVSKWKHRVHPSLLIVGSIAVTFAAVSGWMVGSAIQGNRIGVYLFLPPVLAPAVVLAALTAVTFRVYWRKHSWE